MCAGIRKQQVKPDGNLTKPMQLWAISIPKWSKWINREQQPKKQELMIKHCSGLQDQLEASHAKASIAIR